MQAFDPLCKDLRDQLVLIILYLLLDLDCFYFFFKSLLKPLSYNLIKKVNKALFVFETCGVTVFNSMVNVRAAPTLRNHWGVKSEYCPCKSGNPGIL